MAMSTSTRLALAAVLLVVAAASGAAAAKCSVTQANVAMTPFGLSYASSSNYSQPGKGKKPATPFNRFCFIISSDATYNNKTCAQNNATAADCCVTGDPKFAADTLTFTVDAGCNDKSFGKEAFFALSATATDKKGSKEISSSFKSKDGNFVIKIKSKTSLAGGKDLCLNVPAGSGAKCTTLAQICGAACKYAITTTSFKPAGSKKKQTCCIDGSAPTNSTSP